MPDEWDLLLVCHPLCNWMHGTAGMACIIILRRPAIVVLCRYEPWHTMLSNAVQNGSIQHWWCGIYGTVYQPVIAIGVLPRVYWLLHHQLVLFSVPVLQVLALAIIECASQSCMPAGDLVLFIEIEVSNEYYVGLTVITKICCAILTQKLAWMIKAGNL